MYLYQYPFTKGGKRRPWCTPEGNTLSLRFSTPLGTIVTLQVDQGALASASKVAAALQDCEGDVLSIPGEYSEQVLDHFLTLANTWTAFERAFEVEVPKGWAAFAGNPPRRLHMEGCLEPYMDDSLGEGFLENHYYQLEHLADYMDVCDGLAAEVDALWASHGTEVSRGVREEVEAIMCRNYVSPGRWLARSSQLSHRYPVTFDAACATCIRLPSAGWLELLYSEEMLDFKRDVLVSILAGREMALQRSMRTEGESIEERVTMNLCFMRRTVGTSPVRRVFITASSGEPGMSSYRHNVKISFPVTTALPVAQDVNGEVNLATLRVYHSGVLAPPSDVVLRGAMSPPDNAQHAWRLHMETVVEWAPRDADAEVIIPVKKGGQAFAARVYLMWLSGAVTSTEVNPPHLPRVTQEECDLASAAHHRPSAWASGCDRFPQMDYSWWCDIPPPADAAETPVSVHLVVKFKVDFAGL